MARGGSPDGWVRLDDGTYVVGVVLPDALRDKSVRIVLVARNRKAAVERLKHIGAHGIRLTVNNNPPNQAEIDAVTASPDRLVWRPWLKEGPWQSADRLQL